MTLLWCIAILAPSSFSIKMLARSSRHCEYPDQSRGKSFHHADAQREPGCRQRRFGTSTPQELGFQSRCRGTAFSYRSSSPGSLIRGQARSESTPFNQESHSQWPQRWVTFLWRCQYKFGQKIWPKPSKTAWNPAMWRAPTRTMPRITKSSSSGIFLREFFDSCETDRAQQDRRIQQLSNEVDSLRTRLENLERAQGTRWGSYLIVTCQNCLAKSGPAPGSSRGLKSIFVFGSA